VATMPGRARVTQLFRNSSTGLPNPDTCMDRRQPAPPTDSPGCLWRHYAESGEGLDRRPPARDKNQSHPWRAGSVSDREFS